MCEKCNTRLDQIVAEIRDLLDYGDGPLSQCVKKMCADRGIDGDSVMAVRLAMIGTRAADAAGFTPGPDQGMPTPMVLSRWADIAMTGMAEQLAEALTDGSLEIQVFDISDLFGSPGDDEQPPVMQ